MREFEFFNNTVDQTILNIHTAFIARVIKIHDDRAIVQPMQSICQVGTDTQIPMGNVSAVIPRNLKYKTSSITYRISNTESKTTTVLVPDELAVGDMVYVGICERDITNALVGDPTLSTYRTHDINDGVILKVI